MAATTEAAPTKGAVAGEPGSTMWLQAWERSDATWAKVPAGLKKNSLVAFLLPDFSQCGPGVSAIVPAWTEAIEGLLGVADWSNSGSNAWGHQWFAIWEDPMLCLMSCFCCTGISTGARILAALSGLTCEAACLAGCLTCCVAPCYHASLRTKLRAKYNLQGSKGMDCVLAYCCGPCLMCQEAHEIADHTSFYIPLTKTGKAPTPPADWVAATNAPAATEMKRDDAAAAPTTGPATVPTSTV